MGPVLLLLSFDRAAEVSRPDGGRDEGMPMLEFSSSRVQSGNLKPVLQPYEVRVDGLARGAFEDVHGAISSAQLPDKSTLFAYRGG